MASAISSWRRMPASSRPSVMACSGPTTSRSISGKTVNSTAPRITVGDVEHGACIPLASQATATELIRVLACPKFRLSAGEREELLADYLPYCRSVRIPARLPKLPQCRDANDQMFIELAAVGKSDFLVTRESTRKVNAGSRRARRLSARGGRGPERRGPRASCRSARPGAGATDGIPDPTCTPSPAADPVVQAFRCPRQ